MPHFPGDEKNEPTNAPHTQTKPPPQTTPSTVKSNSILRVLCLDVATGEIKRKNLETLEVTVPLLRSEVGLSMVHHRHRLRFLNKTLPLYFDEDDLFLYLCRGPSPVYKSGRWATCPEIKIAPAGILEGALSAFYVFVVSAIHNYLEKIYPAIGK